MKALAGLVLLQGQQAACRRMSRPGAGRVTARRAAWANAWSNESADGSSMPAYRAQRAPEAKSTSWRAAERTPAARPAQSAWRSVRFAQVPLGPWGSRHAPLHG